MNYKEYSRLRSIARKRIERASAAGKAEYTRIPTVAEVRASANPGMYMEMVKSFLNEPGAGLKWMKAENISFPKIYFPPVPPGTVKTLTEEEKRERKRQQNRLSKARQRIRRESESEAEAKKRVSYLKALQTVTADWEKHGLKVGDWFKGMKPKELKAFTDYMEYRFSQGDYSNKYTIDTFIRDFGEMVKKNYNLSDIESDFSIFLEKQKQLEKREKHTNKYGITSNIIDAIWKKFVQR